MKFKQIALWGGKWTGFGTVGVAVLKLLQFGILAHFLSPSDFGVMAIVMTIIGFSTMFLDVGLGTAVIHKQNITDEELSSVYWLNIIVSLILYLFVFFIAPYIAYFYDEDSLAPIIQLIGSTFIITGFGKQFSILLYKELKFKHLAIISLIATVVSFLVAVVLAMAGFGVYSLVYSFIVDSIVLSCLNVFFGIHIHKPKLVFRPNEIKSLVAFGLFQMGERFVNYLASQFDILLIGKIMGTSSLGLYSVAKNLSVKPYQMINPIINTVTFPIMSIVQTDIIRLRRIYLKVINVLSFFNFPIYILLILTAKDLVVLLFGEQWLEAVVILQVLAGYRMLTAVLNPIGSLLLARGRADLGFYWNLSIFAIAIPVIYIASNWGGIGVAYGLLILQMILFYPSWYFLIGPLSKVSFSHYSSILSRSLLFSVLGGGIGYLAVNSFDSVGMIIRLFIFGFSMFITFLALNKKYNSEFNSILAYFYKQ